MGRDSIPVSSSSPDGFSGVAASGEGEAETESDVDGDGFRYAAGHMAVPRDELAVPGGGGAGSRRASRASITSGAGRSAETVELTQVTVASGSGGAGYTQQILHPHAPASASASASANTDSGAGLSRGSLPPSALYPPLPPAPASDSASSRGTGAGSSTGTGSGSGSGSGTGDGDGDVEEADRVGNVTFHGQVRPPPIRTASSLEAGRPDGCCRRLLYVSALLHSDHVMHTIMFLIFFQVHIAMIQGIYALDVLAGFITHDVSGAACMLTPVFLCGVITKWYQNDKFGPVVASFFGCVCLCLRFVLPYLTIQGPVSAVSIASSSVAFWWLWFVAYLCDVSEQRVSPANVAAALASALASATLASVLFKTLGGSVDITVSSVWRNNGWQISLSLLLFILGMVQMVGYAVRRWWRFNLTESNRPRGKTEAAMSPGHAQFRLSEKQNSPPRHVVRPMSDDELRSALESHGVPFNAEQLHILANILREPAVLSPPRTFQIACGCSRVVLMIFGITFMLTLFLVVVTNPQAIVRWAIVDVTSGHIHALVLFQYSTMGIAAIGVYVYPRVRPPWLRHALSHPMFLTVLNALYLIFTVFTTYYQQPVEPIQRTSGPQAASLYLAVAFSPSLIFSFASLVHCMLKHNASPRLIAGAFTVANFSALLLIFCLVFTYNYGEIEEAGVWRDKYWQVLLLICLGAIVFVGPTSATIYTWAEKMAPISYRRLLIMMGIVVGLGFVAQGSGLGGWTPQNPPDFKFSPKGGNGTGIRVMVYNVHIGFNRRGDADWNSMADEIVAAQPDVLILAESETARLEAGGGDIVWFLGRRMNMKYSIYGAQMGTGTFGVAMLSRFPLLQHRVHFLWSTAITGQRIAVEARIKPTDGVEYTIFGLHITASVSRLQMGQLLALAEGKPHVVFAGDFNIFPGHPVFGWIEESYRDAWSIVHGGPTVPVMPGNYSGWTNMEATNRIDLVWVGQNVTALDIEHLRWRECLPCMDNYKSSACLSCSASDHLPIYADVAIDPTATHPLPPSNSTGNSTCTPFAMAMLRSLFLT